MAKMLARSDVRQQHQRHHRECTCDKSALFFAKRGTRLIRRRARAREERAWRRDET